MYAAYMHIYYISIHTGVYESYVHDLYIYIYVHMLIYIHIYIYVFTLAWEIQHKNLILL